MVQPTLIGPVPRSGTPSDAPRRSRHEPPGDLLREASRRLGILSLTCGALWFVGSLIDRLASQARLIPREDFDTLRAPDVISLGVVSTSIALFAYSRKSTRDPASSSTSASATVR